MATTPQFDPSKPFQEDSGSSSKVPVFDTSKPFEEVSDTTSEEKSDTTPSFDPSQPFQEVTPKEQKVGELTEEYKRQQEAPLSELGGEFASGILPGLAKFATETIPSVVHGTAQILSPTSPTSYWDRTKLLGSSLVDNTKNLMTTGARGTARVLANLTGRINPNLKFSESGLNRAAEQSVDTQEAAEARRQELLDKGFTPDQIDAAGFVADPINIAMLGTGGILEKGAKEITGAALEGAAKTSLGRRAAAKLAESVGNVTEGVSNVVNKTKEFVPGGVAETAELAQKSGIGQSAGKLIGHGGLGYLIGGPTGAIVLGSASKLPAVIENTAQISKAASRILSKGRDYAGFFGNLAAAPEVVSPGVKVMAKFMDKSGLGNLLENGISAGYEGSKVAAMFAPLNIVMTDTPEQAGEMSGNALGLVGLTHMGVDTLNPGNKRLVGLKQANEVAQYVQTINKDATAMDYWTKRFEQNPKSASGELTVVASFKNADPSAKIQYVSSDSNSTGAQNSFNPSSGAITLDLNSSFQDNIGRIMGHETVHKWMASGLRPTMMNELIGNPELGTKGALGEWNDQGQFVPSREFQKFQEKYSVGLSPEQKAQYDAGNPYEVQGRYAEEWLSENIGSHLSSTNESGEVKFNQLRRNSVIDNLFTKFGSFLGDTGAGNLKARWGAGEVATPQLRQFRDVFDKYVKLKEMAKPQEKGFQYSDAFNERAMSDIDMAKNPTQAEKLNKSSNEFQFSTDKDGKAVFKRIRTQRQADKYAQQQAAMVVDVLKNLPPEKPTDLQLRSRSDGTQEYSGTTISDNLHNALVKSGRFNEGQVQNLSSLRQTLNNPGGWLRLFYQPATKGKKVGGRKAAARPGGYYNVIPYDISISQPAGEGKGSNILVRALDISQLEKNFNNAVEKSVKGGPTVPESIKSFEQVLAHVKTMAENHKRGFGATGNALEGRTQIGEAFGALTTPEKNFVNELFGLDMSSNKGSNPLRQVLDERSMQGSTSAIKSFRIDRINDLTPLTEETPIPFNYERSKMNLSPEENKSFSPSEDTEKLNGWMNTSGDITSKGNKYHDEMASQITGNADKTAASDDLFNRNHMRTRMEMGTLFLENQTGKNPTAKQIKNAKDLAIEHNLRGVTFDGPQGPKRLWSKGDESFSPSDKVDVNEIKDKLVDNKPVDSTTSEKPSEQTPRQKRDAKRSVRRNLTVTVSNKQSKKDE